MIAVRLPLRVRLFSPLLRRIRPAPLATRLKHLLGVKRLVVRIDKGSFFVDPVSHLGNYLIRDGEYEPAMEATLRRFLAPGGVFADVGANEGYFSVLAGQIVGPTGRVIAVEPQARLRTVLEENIRLNGLRNVTLSDAAVSDTEGTAELFLAPDLNTGSSGLARHTRYALPTQPVRTATLAHVLADAGADRIDLLKMDIEGFEYEAILGSKELFRTGAVRAFALEFHPSAIRGRGHDPDELVSFLSDCGYREDRTTGNAVFVRDNGG
ncbi:MAG TPA: FkbM family methyltransferase [Gemmataceae bacterium]|nr:FkbM family methyltransferase [Gemmataceae bacterium]